MNEWTLQTNVLEEIYAQLTDKPQKSEILVEKGSFIVKISRPSFSRSLKIFVMYL